MKELWYVLIASAVAYLLYNQWQEYVMNKKLQQRNHLQRPVVFNLKKSALILVCALSLTYVGGIGIDSFQTNPNMRSITPMEAMDASSIEFDLQPMEDFIAKAHFKAVSMQVMEAENRVGSFEYNGAHYDLYFQKGVLYARSADQLYIIENAQ